MYRAYWYYQAFILSNGRTIKYSKKILKFTLQLILKVLLHVSVSTTIIRERGICASLKLQSLR